MNHPMNRITTGHGRLLLLPLLLAMSGSTAMADMVSTSTYDPPGVTNVLAGLASTPANVATSTLCAGDSGNGLRNYVPALTDALVPYACDAPVQFDVGPSSSIAITGFNSGFSKVRVS